MAWKRSRTPGNIKIFSLPGPAPSVVAQRAHTLVEMLVVVTIVALAATIAMPALAPGESTKVDFAASELANAMRFARSEAMRLGVARGFRQQSSTKRVRVFSLDTGTNPATLVYDVYHPIDKQIYDKDFDQQPFAFTGSVSHSRTFRGTCDTPENIYFDNGGIPWCADPDDVLLESFEVTLTIGSSSRVVTLQGITGRVTIQ